MKSELTLNKDELKLIKAALLCFKEDNEIELDNQNKRPRYKDPDFNQRVKDGMSTDYREILKELNLRTNELLDKIDS